MDNDANMIKVAELSDVQLNEWCARANGWWKVLAKSPQDVEEVWYWVKRTPLGDRAVHRCDDYKPSTDFAFGGPVLDWGNITVEPPFDRTQDEPHVAVIHDYMLGKDTRTHRQTAFSYLRSGIRCWIDKNFGPEVPSSVDWTKEREYLEDALDVTA